MQGTEPGDDDPHLTTHPRGETRAPAVLALAGDRSVTAAVIDAVPREGRGAAAEARGRAVTRVWAGMLSAVPGVQGCRLGWDMLLFFVPLECGGEMETALAAVLAEAATADVELRCAVGELHGPADAKVAALDSGLMEQFGSRRDFGSGGSIHPRVVEGGGRV